MKTKVFLFGFLIISSIIILSGCTTRPCIKGNDIVVNETRDVGSFSAVSSEGSFDIYIIQDSTEMIEIEAESNLMPYIYTWVHGNTLVIKEQNNQCIKTNQPIRVYVHCTNMNRLSLSGSGIIFGNTPIVANAMNVTLSGSGDIDLDVTAPSIQVTVSGSGHVELGAETDYVDAVISGSGEILLWGETEGSSFNISGSGNIYSYGMPQKSCFANISGSGDIYVNVSELLDVRISGSGSIFYIGHPNIIVNITGSGTIINQN